MEPSIPAGTLITVEPITNPVEEIERGMIIVHEHIDSMPTGSDGDTYVKRVVAIGGDTLSLKGDVLRINGRHVDEPYTVYIPPPDSQGPVPVGVGDIEVTIVPDGEVFVLGDNRYNSIDSRHYGPVPFQLFTGRVEIMSR